MMNEFPPSADPLLQPTPVLGPAQRRIAGFALTLLAVLGSIALLVGAIIVIGRSISFFSTVLWPLATAAVIALILRPVVDRMEQRLKLKRLSAVIVLYGIVTLAIAGFLLAVVPPLIDQAVNFISYLPTVWDRVVNYIQTHYPQWMELVQRQLQDPSMRRFSEGLLSHLQNLFGEALPSLRAAGGGIVGFIVFFTNLLIVPVYLFFFLLAQREPTHSLPEHLSFVRESVRNDIIFLVREFVSIIEAFFRGQLLISLILGVLLAVGFTVIGLKFGLLVGLLLGMLNIVPFIGSIIGFLITVPLAFFQSPDGGWKLLGLVTLVKLIAQIAESVVLTPKIMGAQTGLHPAVVILAIFFWGTAFGGALGMLLAIPLTAFFVTAWRLARIKYLKSASAPVV